MRKKKLMKVYRNLGNVKSVELVVDRNLVEHIIANCMGFLPSTKDNFCN